MTSKKVFIAADIFLAFVDRAHSKHLHATAFFRYFAQEQLLLYTSPEVVSDVYTILSQTISQVLAKDFIKALSLGAINVIYPEEGDIKLAYKTLLASSSADLSFSEALMASMASKRDIMQICTMKYLHPLFGLSIFYLPL